MSKIIYINNKFSIRPADFQIFYDLALSGFLSNWHREFNNKKIGGPRQEPPPHTGKPATAHDRETQYLRRRPLSSAVSHHLLRRRYRPAASEECASSSSSEYKCVPPGSSETPWSWPGQRSLGALHFPRFAADNGLPMVFSGGHMWWKSSGFVVLRVAGPFSVMASDSPILDVSIRFERFFG